MNPITIKNAATVIITVKDAPLAADFWQVVFGIGALAANKIMSIGLKSDDSTRVQIVLADATALKLESSGDDISPVYDTANLVLYLDFDETLSFIHKP